MNKAGIYVVIFTAIIFIGMMIVAAICIPAEASEYPSFDAEIILPDYILPEVYTTPTYAPVVPPQTPLEGLKIFLANDTTNEHEYNISGDYVCIDFSIDLAYNLTDAGYDAGCVNVVSMYHKIGMWHVLNWVKLGNQTIYIEPQNDDIFIPQGYIKMINDTIHITREISIESAERNRVDQRKWS